MSSVGTTADVTLELRITVSSDTWNENQSFAQVLKEAEEKAMRAVQEAVSAMRFAAIRSAKIACINVRVAKVESQ